MPDTFLEQMNSSIPLLLTRFWHFMETVVKGEEEKDTEPRSREAHMWIEPGSVTYPLPHHGLCIDPLFWM